MKSDDLMELEARLVIHNTRTYCRKQTIQYENEIKKTPFYRFGKLKRLRAEFEFYHEQWVIANESSNFIDLSVRVSDRIFKEMGFEW